MSSALDTIYYSVHFTISPTRPSSRNHRHKRGALEYCGNRVAFSPKALPSRPRKKPLRNFERAPPLSSPSRSLRYFYRGDPVPAGSLETGQRQARS